MNDKFIKSKDNPKVKHLKKLITDKNYRYENKQYVIEGARFLDNYRGGGDLYIREGIQKPNHNFDNTYILSEKLFGHVSDTRHSQGVMVVSRFRLFDASEIKRDIKYVLIDGLQDPGNIGTIMRSTYAFGFKGIIIRSGSVDPFSAKSVRTSAGSIYNLNIIKIENIKLLEKFNVISCDLNGSNAGSFSWPSGFILAVGQEGCGISSEVRNISKHVVTIHMKSKMESLNAGVSAGIMMYLSSRD